MTIEEAEDLYDLHTTDPELTCRCDDFYICKQCIEDDPEIWEDVSFLNH